MASAFERIHACEDVLVLVIHSLAPIGYLDDRTLQPLQSVGLEDVQAELHRLRRVWRRFDELVKPMADKHFGQRRMLAAQLTIQ